MADERRPRGLLDTSVVIDLEQLGRDLSDATQQRDVKLKYQVGASDRVPEPAIGDTSRCSLRVSGVMSAVREHSTVAASLDGVRIKLRRAKDHLTDLRSKLDPIADEATRSIVGAPSEDDPSTLVYRVTRVPDIDPIIAAITGDIVHNLRSALDHVAWQLVVLDNGQPTRDTVFPLHESTMNERGNPRVLTIQPGITDPRIMVAVEAMQPYTEAKYDHEPRTDALGIVGRLDNIDKHRLLLTVVHALDRDMPAYWGSNEGDPFPKYNFNLNPLSVDDRVATFHFDGATPPAHFEPNLKLAITIAESDAAWGQGLDIVEFLDGLRRTVAREININIVPLMGGAALLPWD